MAKRRLMRRRVLHALLLSDLETVSATWVASCLCVSTSTLRRRLRKEGTSYQLLLDQVRRYRCEKTLSQRWLPGKCLASSLGFSQPNSFYRAFGRWTGMTYTQYKRHLRHGTAQGSSTRHGSARDSSARDSSTRHASAGQSSARQCSEKYGSSNHCSARHA